MKIEVERTVKVRETVEVELPVYFKHDMGDIFSPCVLYGRIEENKVVVLKRFKSSHNIGYDWELKIHGYDWEWFLSYVNGTRYHSSEAEFRAALAEFQGVISGVGACYE